MSGKCAKCGGKLYESSLSASGSNLGVGPPKGWKFAFASPVGLQAVVCLSCGDATLKVAPKGLETLRGWQAKADGRDA